MWVMQDDAPPAWLPLAALLRVCEHTYGQRQDRSGNPHGELTYKWVMLGRVVASLLALLPHPSPTHKHSNPPNVRIHESEVNVMGQGERDRVSCVGGILQACPPPSFKRCHVVDTPCAGEHAHDVWQLLDLPTRLSSQQPQPTGGQGR